MSELDPKRIEEIEAEERARAEIRKKIEKESPAPKAPPPQSPYKGMGCGFFVWGTILALLFGFLGMSFPIFTLGALLFAAMALIGILLWLVTG